MMRLLFHKHKDQFCIDIKEMQRNQIYLYHEMMNQKL